jgi:hypothetical protein
MAKTFTLILISLFKSWRVTILSGERALNTFVLPPKLLSNAPGANYFSADEVCLLWVMGTFF